MLIHIIGFSHIEEPLPHELVFCGTYFAFLLISILGIIGFILNYPSTVLNEAIITFIGFLMYLIVSYLSMYNAEHDLHLQYLTDKEEAEHFFFKMSRIQSIASVTGTYLYLMHFVLCLDLLMITKPMEIDSEPGSSEARGEITKPFAKADERAACAPLDLDLKLPVWCEKLLFFKKD
uniref:CSON003005 protein n=1 Tax=Culicoides sonorensis TaxID=179676 RepID=A0A336LV73_CULSO